MSAAGFLIVVGFVVIVMGILWAVLGNALGFGSADAGHSDALVIFGIVVLFLAMIASAQKGNSEVGD